MPQAQLPRAKYELTFSTLLTLVRIFLVPFICVAFINGEWFHGTFLFVIAGITDMLDGFCARLLKQESLVGALLDPMADKILMVATYSALYFSNNVYFVLPAWFISMVVAKEVIQIIGTGILLYRKGPFPVKPLFLAKVTMAAQWLFVVIVGVSSMAQWQLQGFFECLLLVIASLIATCFYYYSHVAYMIMSSIVPHGARISMMLIAFMSISICAKPAASDFCLKPEPKSKLSPKKVTEELLQEHKNFLKLSNKLIEELGHLNQEFIESFEDILVGEDKSSSVERLQALRRLQQLNTDITRIEKELSISIKK